MTIKVLAPQHPEWKDKEPFASLLRGDVKGALEDGEHAILQIVMATHAGNTTGEFEMHEGTPVLVRLPELNFFDDKEGKPIAIHQQIGRRPIAAVELLAKEPCLVFFWK